MPGHAHSSVFIDHISFYGFKFSTKKKQLGYSYFDKTKALSA